MYILIFKKWFYYEAIFPFNAYVETRVKKCYIICLNSQQKKKVIHHLVFFFFFFSREISYINILNIAFIKVFLQNVKNNSLKH